MTPVHAGVSQAVYPDRGLGFIAMRQICPENDERYNFIYFLLVSIVFYLGLPRFSTPYVAAHGDCN